MRARVPAVLLLVWLLAVVGCSDDDDSPVPPTEGDDFTPTADLTLAGSHTYDAIHIPASVTVTASDDLLLRARETVTIEGTLQSSGRAIEIRGDGAIVIRGRLRNPGSGDGDTLGITIVGNGDMTFDGAELVSHGPILIQNDSTLTESDFPDSNGNLRAAVDPPTAGGDDAPIWIIRQSLFGHDRPARAGADRDGEGGNGGDGRDLELRVRGHLQVLDGVTIAAQDGGRGGKGTDESSTNAVAKGGRGGRGGDVSIFATGEITFGGAVTVTSGSGGDGGDAEATGLENDGSGPAASALATGQRAGDSGLIDIRCREAISILGSLTLEMGDGGRGGDADANAADGQPAGTNPAQTGGAATATGGRGGNSPEKRLRAVNVAGLSNLQVTGGAGGPGGSAVASSGDGNDGNQPFPPGGDGGNTVATGGRGGDARVRDRDGNLFAAGGDGGDATIDGGNAGTGWHDCLDPCAPVAGGRGGAGGDGTVEGGRGGEGDPVGTGGDLSIEIVGNGGRGGDGNPVGVHGEAGARVVRNNGGNLTDLGLSFENGQDGVLCLPVTGACCGAERTCVIFTCAECELAGGTWQGAGSTCDPNPCPSTSGACCFDDGSCTLTSEEDCHGGSFQGLGSVCEPNPCPQPTGACCFPTAPCAQITSALCAANDGVYQGDGTSCTPDPCVSSSGACCDETRECRIRTREGCEAAGDYFMGNGTDCDPNPCPSVGACCFPTGACAVMYEPACLQLEGAFRGNGVDCDPDPCGPEESGACCSKAGICSILTRSACLSGGGRFLGPESGCDPDPCVVPDSSGACCLIDGDCIITLAELCTPDRGKYLGNEPCDPSPCLSVLGACCLRDGSCILTVIPLCDDQLGLFLGSGVACAPSNPCSGTGACCVPGVGCQMTTPAQCDGEFLGLGVSCTPDPCGTPSGACCVGFGFCTNTSEAECQGDWLGAGTNCSPSPCPGSPAGTYLVNVDPLSDPQGHDPFTLWSTIDRITFALSGNTLSSSGNFPYVSTSGTLNTDGTFLLSGAGTVAGRSNVSIHFKGRLIDQRANFQVEGTIKLGNDAPPFQLPNGPVTYTITGTRR